MQTRGSKKKLEEAEAMKKSRGKRNREEVGESDGELHLLQLFPVPSSQEVTPLSSSHRYPTRHSNAVPKQSSNANPPSFLTGAWRVLQEGDNNACASKQNEQLLKEGPSELHLRNQGSNASSIHSSECPTKGKGPASLYSLYNSVGHESEDWLAPISKHVENLTSGILKFQEHERIQPSASLAPWHQEPIQNPLPNEEANVGLNATSYVPENTAAMNLPKSQGPERIPSHQESIENNLPNEEADLGLNATSDVPEKSAASHVGKHREPNESSINLTEMALKVRDTLSDDEEVESAIDPALVTVHGYRVKEEVAPLLREIIRKHGDIARYCICESSRARATFLELICSVYQKFKLTNLLEITHIEIKEMLSVLRDLEKTNVHVDWLCQRVNGVSDFKHLLSDYSILKEKKGRFKRSIESKEKNLEDDEDHERSLEDQLRSLRDKTSSARTELLVMKTKAEEIDTRLEDAKIKAKAYRKLFLVDDDV